MRYSRSRSPSVENMGRNIMRPERRRGRSRSRERKRMAKLAMFAEAIPGPPQTYREQLKKKLLEMQKQASEGTLDLEDIKNRELCKCIGHSRFILYQTLHKIINTFKYFKVHLCI